MKSHQIKSNQIITNELKSDQNNINQNARLTINLIRDSLSRTQPIGESPNQNVSTL